MHPTSQWRRRADAAATCHARAEWSGGCSSEERAARHQIRRRGSSLTSASRSSPKIIRRGSGEAPQCRRAAAAHPANRAGGSGAAAAGPATDCLWLQQAERQSLFPCGICKAVAGRS
ncbi:unnamed protein product [Urochloa humidicola]